MNKRPNPELIDAENPGWSDEMVRDAVPFTGLPGLLQAKLRSRGRPKSAAPKVAVKLRLDPDVLEALRATGDGWQTRVNDALRVNLALAGRLDPP